MGLRCIFGLRAFGSPTVGVLVSLLQDSAEGTFTGQVVALSVCAVQPIFWGTDSMAAHGDS